MTTPSPLTPLPGLKIFKDEVNTALNLGQMTGLIQKTNTDGSSKPSTIFGLQFSNIVLVVIGILLVFGGIILLTAESAISGVEGVLSSHKRLTGLAASVAA